MHKSKLISYLKTLNNEEFKRFGQFVKSPYFNQSKPVNKLYLLLKKHHPEFAAPSIYKQFIFNKIYPDAAKFSSRKITDLMARLSLLLQEFIYIEQCRKKENPKQIELIELNILQKRKLDEFFFKRVETSLGNMLNKTVPDAEDYLQIYRLCMMNFTHPNMPRLKGGLDSLHQAAAHLDQFYYLSKLKLACEVQNRQNILKEAGAAPIILSDKFLFHAATYHKPLTDIYLHLLNFIQRQKKEDYEALNELIKQHSTHLKRSTLLEITNLQINLLYKLYKEGETSNLEKILALLHKGFERGIFIENGYIDKDHFLNLINLYATLKKTTEGRIKLLKYQKYLPTDIRQNVVELCDGYLYFSEGQYLECIHKLQYVRFQDLSFKLRVHQLTVQSYFEEFHKEEKGDFLLSSLKAALRRYKNCLEQNDNIAFGIAAANNGFIFFVEQLIKADQLETNYLCTQVSSAKHLICRGWLERKINQLTISN